MAAAVPVVPRPAEFLQPQLGGFASTIFGFVLVLAYAVATIFMELQPARLLAGLAAADLVPRGAARAQSERKLP